MLRIILTPYPVCIYVYHSVSDLYNMVYCIPRVWKNPTKYMALTVNNARVRFYTPVKEAYYNTMSVIHNIVFKVTNHYIAARYDHK